MGSINTVLIELEPLRTYIPAYQSSLKLAQSRLSLLNHSSDFTRFQDIENRVSVAHSNPSQLGAVRERVTLPCPWLLALSARTLRPRLGATSLPGHAGGGRLTFLQFPELCVERDLASSSRRRRS